MENFSYQASTKIIFGKDAHEKLQQELKNQAKRILTVYGSGSVKKNGVYDAVQKQLKGFEVHELWGVQPNPHLSLCYKGIEICKEKNIDFILAVGGGSVIDSAKAIAIGAKSDKDVWDYYLYNTPVEDALPIASVLTIPAAGSEMSDASVITNTDTGYKLDCGAPCLRPKFAILNPEFTYTLPSYQTACGASDILAHMMERYFTRTQSTDLTDRLLEGAMKTLITYAHLAIRYPDNYDIRAEMMWTGTVAHNGFLGVGRIEDWGSHMIEHEISAIYDIAHGEGLAIVFPAWIKYVSEGGDRFVQFARRVFGIDMAADKKEEAIAAGIEALKNFYRSIGLAVSLKEKGITEERIAEMAKKCCERHPVGRYRTLYEKDVACILNMAL